MTTPRLPPASGGKGGELPKGLPDSTPALVCAFLTMECGSPSTRLHARPGPDHRWPWLPRHLPPDEEAALVCVPRARAGAAQQVLYSLPAGYQVWVLERALQDICSLTCVI